MSAHTAQQSLEAVLEQEIQCSQLLLQTLAAERTALAARDVTTLESVINDKVEYYQKLEELETARRMIVSELGFGSDGDSIERCFESLPETGKLAGLWMQIMTNIEECKTSNLVNGGILESGRQQVTQALGILRGQGSASCLYTPTGSTSANLGHRKLGEV